MNEVPPSPLTFDLFAPLKGDIFDIASEGNAVQATLVEVTNLREAQGIGRRSRQFSLIWRGPRAHLVPDRICTVSHPVTGPLELLLVNLGPDDEGMRYEAVFT